MGRGKHFASSRNQAIHRARLRLERDGYPRLQMLLLVALTGGAGFLASWVLLQTGVSAMWLRYLLAMGATYLVFMLLLWVWLRGRAEDFLDAVDVPEVLAQSADALSWRGVSGHSGGGGASASFDSATTPEGMFDIAAKPIGEAMGAAADADEFAIPVAAVIFAVAVVCVLLLSSLLVVWSAPVLFAELLVDGVLAASLYRRLRGLEPTHWLEAAVRRTWLPFVLTTSLVVIAGWGMAKLVPGADSPGDVLRPVDAAGAVR